MSAAAVNVNVEVVKAVDLREQKKLLGGGSQVKVELKFANETKETILSEKGDLAPKYNDTLRFLNVTTKETPKIEIKVVTKGGNSVAEGTADLADMYKGVPWESFVALTDKTDGKKKEGQGAPHLHLKVTSERFGKDIPAPSSDTPGVFIKGMVQLQGLEKLACLNGCKAMVVGYLTPSPGAKKLLRVKINESEFSSYKSSVASLGLKSYDQKELGKFPVHVKNLKILTTGGPIPSEQCLAVGSTVAVQGLKNATTLNGVKCTITKKDKNIYGKTYKRYSRKYKVGDKLEIHSTSQVKYNGRQGKVLQLKQFSTGLAYVLQLDAEVLPVLEKKVKLATEGGASLTGSVGTAPVTVPTPVAVAVDLSGKYKVVDNLEIAHTMELAGRNHSHPDDACSPSPSSEGCRSASERRWDTTDTVMEREEGSVHVEAVGRAVQGDAGLMALGVVDEARRKVVGLATEGGGKRLVDIVVVAGARCLGDHTVSREMLMLAHLFARPDVTFAMHVTPGVLPSLLERYGCAPSDVFDTHAATKLLFGVGEDVSLPDAVRMCLGMGVVLCFLFSSSYYLPNVCARETH